MSRLQETETRKLLRFEASGAPKDGIDTLIVEEPLEIQIQLVNEEEARPISVTLRTPGDDRNLVAGFLFTEGFVENPSQILSISETRKRSCGDSLVVRLSRDCADKLNFNRNFLSTSSCGACGKQRLEDLLIQSKYSSVRENVSQVSAQLLFRIASEQIEDKLYQETGGCHSAFLLTNEGKIISLAQDVGRHNALDKLIGELFTQDKLPAEQAVLLLSGRAGYELVLKAHMAGISLILCRGSATSKAIEMAQDFGITLIGFLKSSRFNCYTHPQRIEE